MLGVGSSLTQAPTQVLPREDEVPGVVLGTPLKPAKGLRLSAQVLAREATRLDEENEGSLPSDADDGARILSDTPVVEAEEAGALLPPPKATQFSELSQAHPEELVQTQQLPDVPSRRAGSDKNYQPVVPARSVTKAGLEDDAFDFPIDSSNSSSLNKTQKRAAQDDGEEDRADEETKASRKKARKECVSGFPAAEIPPSTGAPSVAPSTHHSKPKALPGLDYGSTKDLTLEQIATLERVMKDDDVWNYCWPLLKGLGWRHMNGNGLNPYRYIMPGAQRPYESGVNVLESVADLVTHIKAKLPEVYLQGLADYLYAHPEVCRPAKQKKKKKHKSAAPSETSSRQGAKKRVVDDDDRDDESEEEDESQSDSSASEEEEEDEADKEYYLDQLVTFDILLKHLKTKGWTYVKGKGGSVVDWYYVFPGHKKKDGKRGVDYVHTEELVYDYVFAKRKDHPEWLEGLETVDGIAIGDLVTAARKPEGANGVRGSASPVDPPTVPRPKYPKNKKSAPKPVAMPKLDESSEEEDEGNLRTSAMRRLDRALAATPQPEALLAGTTVTLAGFKSSRAGMKALDGAYSVEAAEQLVKALGGTLLDKKDTAAGTTAATEASVRTITIARPDSYRTEKYIACIAKGGVCVHVNWLVDSFAKKKLLPEKHYTLPRGLELWLQKPEPKWSPAFSWPVESSWSFGTTERRPLTGVVCVLATAESYAKRFAPVLRDLGAEVKDMASCSKGSYLVMAKEDNDSARLELAAKARDELECKIVTLEWVLQAAITGEAPNPSLHSRFTCTFAKKPPPPGSLAPSSSSGPPRPLSAMASPGAMMGSHIATSPSALASATGEEVVAPPPTASGRPFGWNSPPISKATSARTRYLSCKLDSKVYEEGDFCFLREPNMAFADVVDGKVPPTELRLGHITGMFEDRGAYRVQWNRLMRLPSGVLVDAQETVESPIDAIVTKFVCVPVVGQEKAEEVLKDRVAICGLDVDWTDRIYICAR